MFCRCVTFRNLILAPSARPIVRSKHKVHKAPRKQDEPTQKALMHFDDFYKDVFKGGWSSIREALLKPQKYVAVVNNYADVEETITNLENRGALNMRSLFHLRKEYIREKYEDGKHVPYLEKVWRADKRRLQKQEAAAVNEDNEKIEDVKMMARAPNYSLESHLKTAQIDESRIIEPNADLSSNLMGQYLPTTMIKGKNDWVEESSHYRYYDEQAQVTFEIEKEYDIHFPEHLNIFCYDSGNYAKFVSPKKGITDVFNYYVMDGGSILPVLALDIKPGNIVLDMCASPGGKSLVALQTLYPRCVLCNDISYTRVTRIYDVLHQYFYDLKERFIKANKIQVTHYDARIYPGNNFDRILVDVPCTNDRLSVTENHNNIFGGSGLKNRLKLPEIQCELLARALQMVAKNGIVVYSTCSLSPIQNDGVVHMALKKVMQESDRKFVVKDLTMALAQVSDVYYLADKEIMRYGNLVIPNYLQNYGPMYFCKIKRIK